MQTIRRSLLRSGFTLVELLVAIAIISILIALLVPAVEKIPQWLNDMTFGYSPSDQDLVGNRVAPPEPNESPLPAFPGTFYELNWSVENAPSSHGLSAPIEIDGLGTTRVEAIPGNTFGTFGGTLKAERVGDDLLLTSSGEGYLTLDLVDLPFPYLDDVFPPPAFGDEYNQLENMTGFEIDTSFLISSSELAGIPTLEDLLLQYSPRLLTQTGDPVEFKDSNFGETVLELREFSEVSAIPEPATWTLLAAGTLAYAGWTAQQQRSKGHRTPRGMRKRPVNRT